MTNNYPSKTENMFSKVFNTIVKINTLELELLRHAAKWFRRSSITQVPVYFIN